MTLTSLIPILAYVAVDLVALTILVGASTKIGRASCRERV